jgi:anti-sigma B factor antagonist
LRLRRVSGRETAAPGSDDGSACADDCAAGHAVCTLEGDIDLTTADEFRRKSVDSMDQFGPRLTLDLTGVTFMDVTGLGVLIYVRREAEARGGHITLVGTPQGVSYVLRLCGLESAFLSSGSAADDLAVDVQEPRTSAGPASAAQG